MDQHTELTNTLLKDWGVFLGNTKTEPEVSFKYITKMNQYVCFSNVKPTANRVKQPLSGAGYTCPRHSVSKATKTAGAVRTVGQAAFMFLSPGSVGPRKQTSQEHNHTNFLPLHRQHLKCLHPIDTSCYNTPLTSTVGLPVLRGWWKHFNLGVMMLVLKKYRTQPAGPCAWGAETVLCWASEG
jgi:hypothetical protein